MHLSNFIAVILFLLGFLSRANNIETPPFPDKSDTTFCLEVEGRIHNADQNGSYCKVELLLDDIVVDSVLLKSNRKKFRFLFRKNGHYTIRLRKEGFQSKSVCVHTEMEAQNYTLHKFFFETTLILVKADSVPQPPVATIYFNTKKQCFYYLRTSMYPASKEICLKAAVVM